MRLWRHQLQLANSPATNGMLKYSSATEPALPAPSASENPEAETEARHPQILMQWYFVPELH